MNWRNGLLVFLFCLVAFTPAFAQRDTLLFENFEAGWLPAGWDTINGGDESPARRDTNDWHWQRGSARPLTDSMVAAIYWGGGGIPAEHHDDWLITPPINCSTYDTIFFGFWHYLLHFAAGVTNAFVLLSRDNGATWTDTLFHYDSTRTDETVFINISSQARNSPQVRVAFVYKSFNDYYWQVDDVLFLGSGLREPRPPDFTLTCIGNQDPGAAGYPVTATITDPSGVDTASVTLHYGNSSTGPWTAIHMTNVGGNNYSASVPPTPSWTHIYYYVSARDRYTTPSTGYSDTCDFWVLGDYYAYDNTDIFPETPTYSWIELDPDSGGSGINVGLDGRDDEYINRPTPFAVRLWSTSFNTMWISTNGWVSFGPDPGSSAFTNYGIPSLAGPEAVIAAMWDDLSLTSTGHIFYYYDSPNHRFIIEYESVGYWGGYPPVTFEIIVYDPEYYPTPGMNSPVVIQYKEVGTRTNYCTVGIEDLSGTRGYQYLYNGTYNPDSAPLQNRRAIKFTTIAPPHGVLTGRVDLLGRSDDSGAEVTILGLGIHTYTDPSGRFLFELVPPGTYTVVASYPYFFPDTARGVVVALDETTTVNFRLTPMPLGYISGYADLEDTPGADAGIIVRLQGTDLVDTTDATGHYFFDRVTAGTYAVLATMLGYLPEISGVFNVIADETTYVDTLVLEPVDAYYSENFNTTNGGLIADPARNGWEWGRPTGVGPATAHSAPNCWGTIIGGNYATNLADWSLIFRLPRATSYIRFWQWYYTEAGFTAGYDGGNILVSTDGGVHWTLVEPEGGYDGLISTGFQSPIAGQPAFFGKSGGGGTPQWVQTIVDLTPFNGNVTHIRFRFASDNSVSDYPGWYIDDIEAWGWKTGILTGYVYDAGTREPISGATVRGAGHTAISAPTGRYIMYDVAVGYQAITAYKEGYFPSIQRALVTEYDTARANFPMYRLRVSPDPTVGQISYAHTDSFPIVICNPTNNPISYTLSPDGNPLNVRWDMIGGNSGEMSSVEVKGTGREPLRKGSASVSLPATRAGEPSRAEAHARPMARGDVLISYPMRYPVNAVWGVGVQNLDFFWVSDAMATNHDYRFRADTNATVYTGLHYRFYWTPGIRDGFPADMAWDGRNMWQVSAGGTNKIYAFDVFTGEVVDSLADPAMIWTSTWQVGLAYDPDEDVFYVGRWYSWTGGDGGTIYKIKGKRSWYDPGAIIDSIFNSNCAGLAYHPSRHTLFIAENTSPDRIVEVDPETGEILKIIPAPGPAGSEYGMGGAEIDQLGRLWVVNQNDQTVYVLDLDYAIYPRGVQVRPTSGVLPAGLCDTIWVVVEGHTLEPGSHSFNLYIYFEGQTVPSEITVTVNVSPTLNRGWNLISVPVRPDPDDIYIQLRDDLIPFYINPLRSSIWRLKPDEGRYVVPERFARGEGYYLMSYQPNVNFDVIGVPFTTDTTMYLPFYSGSRYPGWYLLGNPFNRAINWDATVYDPAFANVDPTYYALTDRGWATYSPYAAGGASKWIEPWMGFMVRVTPSATGYGVLPFKKDAATPPPVLKTATEKETKKGTLVDIPFTLRISAMTSSGTWDAYNYMGVRTGATDGVDIYDVQKLDMPLPGSDPTFKGYFLLGSSKLARDTRAYFNGQKSWTFVIEAQSGTNITLVWPANRLPDESDDSYGIRRIDSRYSFTLVDNLTGTTRDMRADTTYTFTMTSAGRREFTIRVVASTVGAEEPAKLPTSYELSQNYPNPFNSATLIKFALPKDGDVSLELYNVLGEKVRTLVNADKKAGFYEVIWDGRSDEGIELPSGVYLLRMKSGDFNAEKKLMMLK